MPNYGLLEQASKVEMLCEKLIKDGVPFGFDIETGYTGPNLKDGSKMHFHPRNIIVGFSFTNSLQWARYVPLNHDASTNVDDPVRTARAFWKLLQTGLGVAHNASFELQGLSKWFIQTLSDDPEVGEAVVKAQGLFPIRSDSMLEAFTLNRWEPKAYGDGIGIGLKPLVKEIFGHVMRELKDLFRDEKLPALHFLRFNILDTNAEVTEYACEDSLWCLGLHLNHYDEIMATPQKTILRTELALLPVLARMEKEGMELDWAEYERRLTDTKTFRDQMNEQIQTELSQRLGEIVNVNFNSSKQVADLLFNRLGLPSKVKTDKGADSTSEKALRGIAKADPAVQQILQWRELTALITRYIEKYLRELRYAEDGRAHPNHKQTGATTGRFSVDHVSYQQWPKPYYYKLDDGTEYAMNYRNFLIAPEGYRIVGYDFSQVELRVLAGMSNETSLLKAFEDGVDIHRATASLMMGVPLEQVTGKMRSVGKTLNFAIVYGSGAENIADMLGITKDEAEDYLEKYFAAFPKLKGWMDERVKEGNDTGEVYTKFGRRFTVWEFVTARKLRAKGDDKSQQLARFFHSKGERMCVNAPVQGGAADYMKIGMVRVDAAIRKAEESGRIPVGSVRLVMTIHDALEFYVRDDVETQTVIDIVSPAVTFPVPGLPEIRADWHEGHRWGTVFEAKLDENKKIVGYEMTVELPDKTEVTFKGDTFSEATQDYERWLRESKLDPGDYGTLPGEDVLDLTEEEFDEMIEATLLPEEPVWRHAPEVLSATHVRMSFTEMPDRAAWAKVKNLLAERPGEQLVYVASPMGEKELDGHYGLTDEDVETIRQLLPEAKILVVKGVVAA